MGSRALPAFKPGQCPTISLDVTGVGPDEAAGRRAITRCESLSDRPDPAPSRVTIKRVAAPADHPGFKPGLASSHLHLRIRVGDLMRVKAPSGHLFVDLNANVPAELIGGGIASHS